MANFDPFSDRNDQRDDNWFFKVATKASILGGLIFGANKAIKGPTGKMVRDIGEKIFLAEVRKESILHTDQVNFTINGTNDYDLQQITKPRLDSNLVADHLRDGATTENLFPQRITSIKRIEDLLVKRTSVDKLPSYQRRIWARYDHLQKMGQSVISTDVKTASSMRNRIGSLESPPFALQLDETDILLADTRKEALLDHFSTVGSRSETEITDVMAIDTKGTPTLEEAKKISRVHESYLEDPQYSSSYKKIIQRTFNKYRSSVKELRAIKSNSALTRGEIRAILNGGNFIDDAFAHGEQHAFTGMIRGEFNYRTQGHLKRTNLISELLKKPATDVGKFTSGNLDDSPINWSSKNKSLKKISSFDYTGQLKQLANTLERIVDNVDDTGIDDVKMEMVQSGQRGARKHYVVIQAHHKNSNQWHNLARIPLTSHGIMPGSHAGAGDLIDGLYVTRRGKTLRDIIEVQNKSQLLIKHVVDRLNSRLLEGEFQINPEKVTLRLNSELRHMMNDMPRVTGELRDFAKFTRVVDPLFDSLFVKGRLKAGRQLKGLDDTVASANAIRQISSIKRKFTTSGGKTKGIKSIAIDFETLSRTEVGPNLVPSDPLSQITKAAMVTMDVGTGAVDHVDEIVSDHGFKVIDDLDKSVKMGWNEENTGFLKSLIGDQGKNLTDPRDIAAKYGEILTQESKRSMKRSGHGKFKDNTAMIREFGNRLLRSIENASEGGKNHVVLTTKNGAQFDFRLINVFAPDVARKIEKLHVDIQGISNYRKNIRGGTSRSLGLNKLVSDLLGRLGEEPIDIDKPGNAVRALKAFQRKGFLLKDRAKFDSLLNDWNKLGYIEKAHQSPVVDNLFTQILLLDEIDRAGRNDSVYQDIDNMQRYLASTNTSLGIGENLLMRKELAGRAVPTIGLTRAGYVSVGMLSKNILSTIGLNHMLPMPANNLSKQWDQLHRGTHLAAIKGSKYYSTRNGNVIGNKAFKKLTTNPLTTDTLIDATQHSMRAHDMTSAMSHNMMMNTLYLWNPSAGREGLVMANPEAFRGIGFHQMENIALDQNTFAGRTSILNNIHDMGREIHIRAKELAKAEGRGQPSRDLYNQAASEIWEKRRKRGMSVRIKPGQSYSVSQGDMGVQTIKSQMHGELVDVIYDGEAEGKARLTGKFKFTTSTPEDLERLPIVARSMGTKASVIFNKNLSSYFAHGEDIGIVANADFIEKKYVGSLKEIAMRESIRRFGEMEKSSDPAIKAKAKKELKNLEKDLNAKWVSSDQRMIVKTQSEEAMKNIKFRNIHSITEKNDAISYLGVANISVDRINHYMKNAGMVWNDDSIEVRNRMFGGQKNLENRIIETIKSDGADLDDIYNNSTDGLQFLMKDDRAKIENDRSMILRSWLVGKRGDPTLFTPVKMRDHGDPSKQVYQLGVNVRDSFAFHYAKGSEPRVSKLKLRKFALDMLSLNNSSLTSDWVSYLKGSTLQNVERKSNDIAKSMNRYVDSLFAAAIATKPLSLDEIKALTERRMDPNIRRELKRSFSEKDLDLMEDRIKELIDFDELSDNATEQIQSINQLRSALEENKIIDNIEGKRRLWTTATEASYWSRLAKVKKVWSIKADSPGQMFDFDFQDAINRADPAKRFQVQRQNDKLITLLSDIYNKNQEEGVNGMVHSLIRDEYGNIVKARLRTFLMPADISADTTAEFVNKYIGHTTIDNIMKFDVFKTHEIYIDTLAQLGENHETTKHVKRLRDKKALEQMALGVSMKSDGASWKAAREAQVPSLRLKHVGADAVITQAYLLKNQGGFSALKKFKGGSSAKARGDSVIDAILNSEANVAIVRKSVAEKAEVVVDGDRIQLGKHLDNIFANKRKTEWEKILSGKAKVGGAFSRDPTHASGIDSVRSTQFMMLDDDVADALGISKTAVHMPTIWSRPTGADSDGDEVSILFKNFKSVENFWEQAEMAREKMKEVINRPDTLNAIEKFKLEKVVGYTGTGNVLLQGYETKGSRAGNLFIKAATHEEADKVLGEQFSQLSKFARSAVSHDNKFVTSKFIEDQVNHALYPAISKDLIGVYTNVAFKRGIQLQMKKSSIAPADWAAMFGTTKYGITGLAQSIIDFGKHANNIAKYSKAASFLQTMDNRIEGGREALQDIMVKDGWEPVFGREKAEELFNTFINTTKQIDIDMRNDKEFRIRANSEIASNLGLKTSSMIDDALTRANRYLEEFGPDIQQVARQPEIQTAFGNFTDALKHRLDLSNDVKLKIRKTGKYGAIAAAGFLALNFFRPNQLSNSMNPLDGFSSLGNNDFGEPNKMMSNLELSRRVPLDAIDASFSKTAYIRLNKKNNTKQQSSTLVNSFLKNYYVSGDNLSYRERKSPGLNYRNYTTNIGFFGNSSISRR